MQGNRFIKHGKIQSTNRLAADLQKSTNNWERLEEMKRLKYRKKVTEGGKEEDPKTHDPFLPGTPPSTGAHCLPKLNKPSQVKHTYEGLLSSSV